MTSPKIQRKPSRIILKVISKRGVGLVHARLATLGATPVASECALTFCLLASEEFN
jgi:hypothetical protein